MKKEILIPVILIVAGIIFITVPYITSTQYDPGNATAECSADADCVPASCCHPTACVPAEQAPECSDVFCTEECRPGTLDCGQGSCSCMDGHCEAVYE
ncbi:MAG: hypothetical protein ACLFTH_04810 [Candidatus Woesearchaeota archaeon]